MAHGRPGWALRAAAAPSSPSPARRRSHIVVCGRITASVVEDILAEVYFTRYLVRHGPYVVFLSAYVVPAPRARRRAVA